jgi:hypothetical protein
MKCRLTASVSGDPAPLYEMISSVEGPGLVDWPDVDPRAGVEATIGMLLRPGAHGGATTFDQARRVAVDVHERLAERIERERRSVDLGRVVPLDLQSIRPIPREILIGGYNAGGRDWLLDRWGVDRPLANVDLVVRQEIGAEARSRGRPRTGSTPPRAWTQTRAIWTFSSDRFPFPAFRKLLGRYSAVEFRVRFKDNNGMFDRTWEALSPAIGRLVA